MDIVVKGRNVEVPDHYRQHVSDKLNKVERYDHKLIRVDVELFHEPNRRQSERCQRVEITCMSRGPVVRAEASARDFYTALDAAASKLQSRLRRAADRRRVHHGRHRPISVAAATARLVNVAGPHPANDRPNHHGEARPDVNRSRALADDPDVDGPYDELDDQRPGRIVREKEHRADSIALDDALFEMELVGHDFYLFLDKESGKPSVVYRRKGYDYGVIRLAT